MKALAASREGRHLIAPGVSAGFSFFRKTRRVNFSVRAHCECQNGER